MWQCHVLSTKAVKRHGVRMAWASFGTKQAAGAVIECQQLRVSGRRAAGTAVLLRHVSLPVASAWPGTGRLSQAASALLGQVTAGARRHVRVRNLNFGNLNLNLRAPWGAIPSHGPAQ